MKQKLLNDHQQTVTCLMSQGQNLLREMGQYDRAAQIADALKEAQSRQKPTIMFYGLYNAGKSTLINAISRRNLYVGSRYWTLLSVPHRIAICSVLFIK